MNSKLTIFKVLGRWYKVGPKKTVPKALELSG